jgi:hypothetical protein
VTGARPPLSEEEQLDEQARNQAARNGYVSAMVTNAGWQCPVCDSPGHVHQERCFVKELADEAHRLRVANIRLCQTNGRLRRVNAGMSQALQLAEGLTLVHDIEYDDDPESFADLTGFDTIDCRACLFNVARGKRDRRDPEKVAALDSTKEPE